MFAATQGYNQLQTYQSVQEIISHEPSPIAASAPLGFNESTPSDNAPFVTREIVYKQIINVTVTREPTHLPPAAYKLLSLCLHRRLPSRRRQTRRCALTPTVSAVFIQLMLVFCGHCINRNFL